MELTEKAKEEFGKWLESQVQQVNIWSWQFNGFDLELFYKLPFSMQYGVYVDFFWHEGGELILISESVQVDILNGFITIEEAREQAIKKANEIFNNKN